jgi:hypothetical protein
MVLARCNGHNRAVGRQYETRVDLLAAPVERSELDHRYSAGPWLRSAALLYTDEYSPYLNRLRFFRVTAQGTIDTGYGANGATVDAFQWDEIVGVTFGDDHRVLVTGLSYEEQDSRPVARRYWY